jgi:type II secretory pathway component PulF
MFTKMPAFRYEALDRSGQKVSGAVDANSTGEAARALNAKGLMVTKLDAATTVQTQVKVQRPPTVASTPVRPMQEAQLRTTVVSPASGTDAVRTKFGTPKENAFLFTQLASLFRTGVNPRSAIEELANRARKPWYQQALREIANRTGEGQGIADALARYPYLFPQGAVGMIRAGEKGGFLPEAAEAVADSQMALHEVNRSLNGFKWWFAFLLVGFGGSVLATRASLASMNYQQDNQTFGDARPIVAGMLGKQFIANIPWVLLTVALWISAKWIGRALPRQELRHRLGAIIPFLGGRARSEAITAFSFAAGRLAHAGVPPRTTFELAADAVPNRDLAERLKAPLAAAGTNTKMSELIGNSDLIPADYRDIAATADLTGDMPKAMDHVSAAMRAEFIEKNNAVRRFSAFIFIPLFGLLTLAMLIYLYKSFYVGMMDVLLKE